MNLLLLRTRIVFVKLHTKLISFDLILFHGSHTLVGRRFHRARMVDSSILCSIIHISKRNNNQNIIRSIYKRFTNKTVLFSIVCKIIVNRMLLIVIFGADLGGIVLTLNSIRITIKTTFNGYSYCWDGILYFVLFDNGSRKLIKFDKNCVLSCGTCLIHRIYIRYSLRLIVIFLLV